jgi:hypothetical protein
LTKTQWSRAITLSGAVLVALALVLGLTPSPAGSETQQQFTARAEAKALTISVAGSDLLLGDPRVADTTQNPVESGDTSGDLLALPLLGDLLAAGVAAQEVAVDDAGNSAACAGLIAAGGQLQISAETPPECTAVLGDPNGLVLNLTGLGLVRLRADAIYAACTANAFGGTDTDVRIANLAVEVGTQLGLFTVWTPAFTFDGTVQEEDVQVPALTPLAGLIDLTLNDVPDIPEPGVAETTALHLSVLSATGGEPLVDVEIGHVRCGANTVATGTIDFDTSGSLDGTSVQPQTNNALLLQYTPDTAHAGVTLAARLGEGVVPDDDRGLPAGCTLVTETTGGDTVETVFCPVGPVGAGETAERVIPVELAPDIPSPARAELFVFGPTVAEVLMGPVVEEEDVEVESTGVAGDAGGLAVPSPNRTGLPNDIDGTLYLDVPGYVEEAAYGGTPCTPAVGFAPATDVYPAVGGTNVVFDCGSSIAQSPGSEHALAFTYAADAPETAGTPDDGRVLIIRDATGFTPQELPENSYYADLDFFVNEAVVPPTTTSTAPASTTSSTSGATTSSTSGATTSSTDPGSTTSSTDPGSTTSSTDPGSSTTVAASSSSRPATATKARPLARTGSDTRTTLSIAVGLLGAGMVVTGRGMQAEASPLSRRRRP